MTTKTPRVYSDLAIPPGETLAEELEVRGMTQEELADNMGCSPQMVNEIIRAERAITPEIASALGKALGIETQFWTNLEDDYRMTLEHIRAKAACASSISAYPREGCCGAVVSVARETARTVL